MSKRYGRNQKRQHRAAIAALEHAVAQIQNMERRLKRAVEISATTEYIFEADQLAVTGRFDAPADVQAVRVPIDQLTVSDFMRDSSRRADMARKLAERIVEQLPGGMHHR